MDKKPMANFLTNIQRYSQTDLEVELPDPDDKHFEEFYNHYKDKI